MTMARKAGFLLAGTLLLSLAAGSARAQFSTQLGSPGALNPADTTLTYPGGAFTDPGHPVVINAGGNTVTFTDAGGTFQRVDQGNGWNGDFAPGTPLLWTNGNNGPLDIVFASGVDEVGFQVQMDFFGAEQFVIDLFDGLTQIGSYAVNGSSTPNGDNSAAFFGAKADPGYAITKVHINGVLASANPQDFAIGPVTFGEAAPINNVVPEPGSLAMLAGMGLSGLGLLLRRRAR